MKKIIFLDIDGVLQPCSNQDRFNHDLDRLKKRFVEKENEGYKTIDKYDIGAVFYDWKAKSIELIKELCERTGAKFVISSAWRMYRTIDELRLLFKIYDLDGYIMDTVPYERGVYGKTRADEIKEYLDAHPDIDTFCILDDAYYEDFMKQFPNNFVYCKKDFFNESNFLKALKILGEDKSKISRLGSILIVSGPSGVGKTSLCHSIIHRLPMIKFSVSCTTREPRYYEENGVDYYFVDVNEFKEKIKNSEFLEYARVHAFHYGTLKEDVINTINEGIDILLDIDVQGAEKIKEEARENKLIAKAMEFLFIAPPGIKVLEERIQKRNTERTDAQRLRLENAKRELEKMRDYEYVIINDEYEKAVSDMTAWVKSSRLKTKRLKNITFDFT